MIPALPDPQLRVSASHRDLAARTLREAASDGRLTFEELETRLPQALASTTRGDLYGILHDLVPAKDLPEMFESGHHHSDAPGMSWDNPLVIREKYHEGLWDVPPFVEIVTRHWTGAYVSFIGATPLATTIDLTITGGDYVQLVVPQGWGVDLQQVTSPSGTKNDSLGFGGQSRVPTRPARGMPRLVISGSITPGYVAVREPKKSDLRRHAKALRRQAKAGAPHQLEN